MHELVESKKDPAQKDAILDGSFFEFICPDCGYSTSVLYSMRYLDESQKLIVDLLEEEASSFEEKEGYTNRIVSNPNELVEKILIFDAGKDDRIIEMEKALLEQQLLEEGKDYKIAGMYFTPISDTDYGFAVMNEEGFVGEIPFDEALYSRIEKEMMPKIPEDHLKKKRINLKWVSEIHISEDKMN